MSLSRDCILSRLFDTDFVAISVASLRSDIFSIIELEDKGFPIRKIFSYLRNCNITIPNYVYLGVPHLASNLRFLQFEDQFLTLVFHTNRTLLGYVIIGSFIYPLEGNRFKEFHHLVHEDHIDYRVSDLEDVKECLFA